MDEEVLAQFQEGQPAFPDTEETETPTESPAENKPAETTPESSPEVPKEDETPKSVPFHEDPKIQEYINRQVENRIKDVLPKDSPKEESTSLPSWWAGDEASYNAFKADIANLAGEQAKAQLETYEQSKTQQEKAIQEAIKWRDESFQKIDQMNGQPLDDNFKNRIMKKLEEEKLVDTEGRWNYAGAYKLIKAEDTLAAPKPNTAEKKRIAAASTAKESDVPANQFTTDSDIPRLKSRWNW